ncbi:hypothetical protein BS17DRAFT_802807 [Gyrodon lividus]|nr:hypothetical protein BS17DRAFT_802807 [Gyrodon lividus]
MQELQEKSQLQGHPVSLPSSEDRTTPLPASDQNDFPNYSPVAVDPLVHPLNTLDSFLVNTLVALSETRSRISILNALTNTLKGFLSASPSLQFALPSLFPIELGIDASVTSKTIQHVSAFMPVALRRLYNSSGDSGDVAVGAKSNVRTLVPHPPLLIKAVYESLPKIAHVKGQAIMEQLLISAKGEETRYLVRTLSLNLRVGAVRTSILTALARALVLAPPFNTNLASHVDSPNHVTSQCIPSITPSQSDTKSKVADVQRDERLTDFTRAEALAKRVYVQHPNYDHIVAGVLEGGLEGLFKGVSLTVGIPLHPTLGSPTRSLNEIYDRLNETPFTVEFKYDGQRAQIYASRVGNECLYIHIFSRHLENMTTQYLDVISLVRWIFERASSLRPFIIDSEIVAIDPSDSGLTTLQELSNRAKKNAEFRDVKVPVCVFAFDLMYLDGEILLERLFRERRALLRTRFPALAPEESGTARFDHKAVENRCEGLMIKLLDTGEIQQDVPHQKGMTRKKHLPTTYEPDKHLGYRSSSQRLTTNAPISELPPDRSSRKITWKAQGCGSCAFSKQYLALRYVEGPDNCSYQPLWDCETGGFTPDMYFRPHEVWEIRGAKEHKDRQQVSTSSFLAQTYRDQPGRGKDDWG